MLYFPNFLIRPTIELKKAKSKKNGRVIMQLRKTCDHLACVMFFYGSLIDIEDSRLIGFSVDTKIT